MEDRRKDISDLKSYIENTDKEITMILRNFFWDQKHLLEKPPLTGCSYISHHKVPEQSKSAHEEKCYLTRHGYDRDELLLPDVADEYAQTLVNHSKQEIHEIIQAAARLDPTFKTIVMLIFLAHVLWNCKPCQGPEPLSVDRLQQTYTADERRAIHDAVVNAAPFCHDLAELSLGSNMNIEGKKTKTRLEVLAELRNMRRRRVKYRVASKTSNYSNVLKDVIKTQMDLYAESNGMFIKTEYGPKTFVSLNDKDSISSENKTPEKFFIKQERVSPETEVIDTGSGKERQHDYEKRERGRDRYRDRENSRYTSNTCHENRNRSRDRDKNMRRYKDGRDGDKSTDYRRKKREPECNRSHRNEKNDNEKSYHSRYESRDSYDNRYRQGGRLRYADRYIGESRIKIENNTDIIEPVEIKQEIMDDDEVRRGNVRTYDDKVTETYDEGVQRVMDSQEHEDRDAYRYRNEYRNRFGDEDRYSRENREQRRRRNRDEDINNDQQQDRHRNNDRDDDGNRHVNRNNYNDRHSEDNNLMCRHENKYENRHRYEKRRGNENSYQLKHENRNEDDDRHKSKSENGCKREGKSQDNGSRQDRYENSHRHKDKYRHRERHAMDKRKSEESSSANCGYSRDDTYVISGVKPEKDLL